MDPVPPQTVPVNGSLGIFDVTLVGVNPTTGYKLLMTIGSRHRSTLAQSPADDRPGEPSAATSQFAAVLGAAGYLRGHSDHPDAGHLLDLGDAGHRYQHRHRPAERRTGLRPATGDPVALRPTSILRGDTFGVGDHVTMGGVRGDVVRLGFLKTTVMEMGQPPSVADEDQRSG